MPNFKIVYPHLSLSASTPSTTVSTHRGTCLPRPPGRTVLEGGNAPQFLPCNFSSSSSETSSSASVPPPQPRPFVWVDVTFQGKPYMVQKFLDTDSDSSSSHAAPTEIMATGRRKRRNPSTESQNVTPPDPKKAKLNWTEQLDFRVHLSVRVWVRGDSSLFEGSSFVLC